MKLVPASDIDLHCNPYSADTILQHFMSCSATRPCTLINYWKCAVVIYSTKEVATIKSRNVNGDHFPWFACYYCGITLFWDASVGTPFTWNTFLWIPLCLHLCRQLLRFLCWELWLLSVNVIAVKMLHWFHFYLCQYCNLPTIYYYYIAYCELISTCPVGMYVLAYICPVCWPSI